MFRRPPLKDRLDKAMLERLYERFGLSTMAIAERYGVTSAKIRALMDEYGIPRNNRRAPRKAPANGEGLPERRHHRTG